MNKKRKQFSFILICLRKLLFGLLTHKTNNMKIALLMLKMQL